MALFSTLPVKVNDFSLPKVNRNDIKTFSDAEFGAYGHWMFDKGNSGGLTDIAHGRTLTVGDVTPAYTSNFLSITNGPGDGLRSDLDDTDVDDLTMWAVARQPVADGTNGNRFLFGSQTGSAGVGAMASGASTSLTITGRLAASGNPYAAGTATVNDWFFIAVSVRMITNALAVLTKLNASSVQSFTPLAGVTKAGLPLSCGNYHYATGPAAAVIQFAEFGLLEALLTADEMDGLYARAKTRMAARGITI